MTTLSIAERDGTLVVDSRLIAAELGIEHKNLLETLNKYLEKIESAFGSVAFETREFKTKQGNRTSERVAYLSEDQSTLLMTFSRNTARVVECKIALVQAFSEAKKAIVSQSAEIQALRQDLESLKTEIVESLKAEILQTIAALPQLPPAKTQEQLKRERERREMYWATQPNSPTARSAASAARIIDRQTLRDQFNGDSTDA